MKPDALAASQGAIGGAAKTGTNVGRYLQLANMGNQMLQPRPTGAAAPAAPAQRPRMTAQQFNEQQEELLRKFVPLRRRLPTIGY
jgi:hypothetical protein